MTDSRWSAYKALVWAVYMLAVVISLVISIWLCVFHIVPQSFTFFWVVLGTFGLTCILPRNTQATSLRQ